MFQWDQKRSALNLSPGRILRLERSLNDVQVTLPGGPPEDAGAYLCAFGVSGGVRVAVVLHQRRSGRLAFYFNSEGDVDQKKSAKVIDDGHQFAESLGFMLGDLDFPHLSDRDKQKLWDSLPFCGENAVAKPNPEPVPKPAPKPPPKPAPVQPAPPVAAPKATNKRLQDPAPKPETSAAPDAVAGNGNSLAESLGRVLGML